MKRGMPEFMAIPVTIVVLGIVFVILFAADAGGAVWVAVGVVGAVVLAAAALFVIRRPRGSGAAREDAVFDGAAPPAGDGVHRVLLVVDRVCAPGELAGVTRSVAAGGTRVFVAAAAAGSRLARLTGDEEAYARARDGLDETLRALGELGVEAGGHVGSHDPLQAADEALREFPADEIVFALEGGADAEWLERGVVDLARARYAVPVRELDVSAVNER